MMQTTSLVAWKRNENMSNIYVSAVGGDEMFLKPYYVDVFNACASVLKHSVVHSFVELWSTTCDNACRDANLAINKALAARKMQAFPEAIDRIVTKFRGNLGEIMAEMLACNGILDFIKPGTYKPVDPTHEEFIDASGERNGMLVGIQVKNYTKHNKVSQEVFLKASAMSDLWLRRDKIVPNGCLEMFTSTPCQYIISMSDPENELLEKMFKGSVVFLGPKWIDSKRIQGSFKTKESSKWKMLEEVAEEIDSIETI